MDLLLRNNYFQRLLSRVIDLIEFLSDHGSNGFRSHGQLQTVCERVHNVCMYMQACRCALFAIMAGRGGAAKLVGTLRMYIPAGQASPSPPLGPSLGQV